MTIIHPVSIVTLFAVPTAFDFLPDLPGLPRDSCPGFVPRLHARASCPGTYSWQPRATDATRDEP